MSLIDRIVFMGSPDYALPTLDRLVEDFGKNVVAVFSQPDKPKGRGLERIPTPVKSRALALGIPVFTPLNKEEVAQQVLALNPTLIVVIAYGMILSKSVTEAMPCLNLHGSLLPAYRGASPIQTALLNGDATTGVTLIRMNERMDAGPMLAKAIYAVSPKDNGGSVFNALSLLSADLLSSFLKKNTTLSFSEETQNDENATYCKKLHSEDFQLFPDQDTPTQMLNKIRAFSPKPGAFLLRDGKRIKVLEATLENGTLIPVMVQPEGKGQMPYKAFLAGNQPLF